MSLLILLIKISVPPVLVAAMTLVARRWGPTVGGLIMALPWMTGPVLYFLGRDKGDAFVIQAATGVELGVIALVGYILVYAFVAGVAGWPLSLAAAIAAFVALSSVVRLIDVGIVTATLIGLSALVVARTFLPHPKAPPRAMAPPAWDIPARMLATFTLVAIVLTSADRLGGQLSGIFATFPVVLTVIGTFTHHQLGTDAIRAVLRAVSLSLVSFAAFFLTVALTLPWIGLAASFVAALAVALSISGSLLLLASRR